MVDKSVSALITDIQTELHQVAGPGVQLYSENMLVSRINNAFITFFEDPEIQWKRFEEFATYTLDGITGRCTNDVSADFKDYNHIYRVYPANSDKPLDRWNTARNPSLITGNAPLFVRPTSVATKIFQVIPATATGNVTVVGKMLTALYPFDDLADIVPFDHLAIVYYCAWQELVDDETSPAAASKMQKLFQNRYKQLQHGQTQETVSYSGGRSALPTRWYDSDV